MVGQFSRWLVKSELAAKQVAEWMLDELKRKGDLYQDSVVGEIAKKFGGQFTYTNDNGNEAIRKDVLFEFRKLSKDTAVWEREERYWRMRKPGDGPGREQS
jgi:hypothetical protein